MENFYDQSPETSALDWVNSLGGLATGILGAVRGTPKSSAPPPAAAATKPNWTLIGIIGGAVALVLVLVLANRK
jgi:hypothetical protein